MLLPQLILLVLLLLPGTPPPLSHSLTCSSNVFFLGSGPRGDRPCQGMLQSSFVAHTIICKCTFIGLVIDEDLFPVPLPMPNHFPDAHILVPSKVPGTQLELNNCLLSALMAGEGMCEKPPKLMQLALTKLGLKSRLAPPKPCVFSAAPPGGDL